MVYDYAFLNAEQKLKKLFEKEPFDWAYYMVWDGFLAYELVGTYLPSFWPECRSIGETSAVRGRTS